MTFFLVVLFIAFSFDLRSQTGQNTHPNSPVFKNYQPPTATPRLEQSDATYQMWEGFRVLQQANAGDAVSQFELSIRFLAGRGFKADTTKAVYWTKRAAEKNHLLARFNLGIFQFNGWGMEWNPFESYRSFRYAAVRNIPEAQYALAQFLTENLVVPTNWSEAYRWVKLAADSGYAPARDALKEFARRGYGSDSSASGRKNESAAPSSGAIQLLFINFSSDTIKATPDSLLVDDLYKAATLTENVEVRNTAESLFVGNGRIEADSASFRRLLHFAEAGSPEALTLVGRCYEKGFRVDKNILAAATYYIRAIRLDSPRASRLLFSLIQESEFFPLLKTRVNGADADAEFVWSCLIALGLDRQLTDTQAFHLLGNASARNHAHAMVELGLCYYTGRWVKKDEGKALQSWRNAAAMGSKDAKVRLAIAKIRGRHRDNESALPELQRAADGGSVLAEFALGYCYETGSGVPKDKGKAVRLYRTSAQRGSQDAFRALQRMHDALRPNEKQFHLDR